MNVTSHWMGDQICCFVSVRSPSGVFVSLERAMWMCSSFEVCCVGEIMKSENPLRGVQGAVDNFKANRKGLNRQNQKDDAEAWRDFWSIKGTSYIVIKLKLEFSLRCRRKNHSQYHCDTLM